MKKLLILIALFSINLSGISQEISKHDSFYVHVTNSIRDNNKYSYEDLLNIVKGAPFDESGDFTLSEVVKVEGVSQKDLFKAVNLFVVEAYKDASNVIQLNDPETSTIICKGTSAAKAWKGDIIVGAITQYETMHYTLKIQCKDDRFKIDIYDINVDKQKWMSTPAHYLADKLDPEWLEKETPSFGRNTFANFQSQFVISDLNTIFSLKYYAVKTIPELCKKKVEEDW